MHNSSVLKIMKIQCAISRLVGNPQKPYLQGL